MILCTESIFSLEILHIIYTPSICFRLTFINRHFQCIRLTMWHCPRGSFKLWPFWSISGLHQILINKTLLQPTFVLKWIQYVFHYFILNTPYLIIRSIFLNFAIYQSKVNTSLKNKICFKNIYMPSKFITLCPESLKEHTDKFSLRSDETQTFYWSFKCMSNYHLN